MTFMAAISTASLVLPPTCGGKGATRLSLHQLWFSVFTVEFFVFLAARGHRFPHPTSESWESTEGPTRYSR